MASTHPIIPESAQNAKGSGSPGRQQSHSQRSSISGSARSSNTGLLGSGDASVGGAKPSTRGRKPFEISEEVDRGLVRVLDSTDVSFDKLAQAVEDSGGPRKLWLRRRFERITDTKTFGGLRLSNHRAGADERRRQQQTAMSLAVAQPGNSTDQEQQEVSTQPSSSGPSSRTSWIVPQMTDASGQESVQRSVLQTAASIPNQNVDETIKRPSALTSGPRRRHAGDESRRQSEVRAPAAPSSTIARSLTTPTPAKRALTEDLDDIPENDYGARKDRTRALSLGAIILRLEDLTGQTGLYQHIKRISVKSHISPRFPTFRFSRTGSRRASGGSTAATTSIYEQQSPNGSEAVPIVYDPDPDYETFYHDPTPGRIARLESDGAVALVALMQAKSMAMSDEDAESHLLKALPDDKSALDNAVNATDDTGVTSLHLAVAYGYPRVCKHLMLNGANAFAVTHRGSSVCRFARPAQDFAKETSLYHRILNCRQWICAGLPPPIAAGAGAQDSTGQEGSKNSRPKQKRVRTNETVSTLFRVDETPTEDTAGASNDNPLPFRTSMVSDRYSGLTPLITGFEFGMRNSMHGSSTEQSASLYDDNSPLAISRRSCLRDHSTVLDLLTPNSYSPDTVLWPTTSTFPVLTPAQTSSSLLPSSQPINVEATTHQYDSFGGLNIYNGQMITQAPIMGNIYTGAEQAISTSILAPGIPSPYHWPDANLQHSDQMFTSAPYIPDSYSIQNTTFDYQGAYQGGVSQPHYPTPPIDGRPVRPQETWQAGWDLPRATAMALAEASVGFPTTMWPEPPQHDGNNRSYYHNHEPNAYDPNDSAPF